MQKMTFKLQKQMNMIVVLHLIIDIICLLNK